MVQIAFTSDQTALRESMRRFFSSRAPLTALRKDLDHAAGLPDYWDELARLDVLSLGVPAELGGAGVGLVDLVALYLEMGRSLALTPHLQTAIVSAALMTTLADSAQRSLLDRMISGRSVVIPALREQEEPQGIDGLSTVAQRHDDGWSLRGEKVLVPFAQVADHLIVSARTPDGGPALFLLPARSSGVTLTPMPNLSSLPLFAVSLDDVSCGQGSLLGPATGAGWAIDEALDRAAVLRCAEISGAGERLLEMCVDYAKTREQFGRPIGSYQAVQYLCTEIAIRTRVTLLLAVQAAARIDGGQHYRTELAAARRYAKKAAAQIVSCAHELHAGVGFMQEHDLHLYTRRSKHWQFELGDDDDISDDLISGYLADEPVLSP